MITRNYSFQFSDSQYDKLNKWYEEVVKKHKKGSKNFGAIGGGVSFVITPTSIGTFVTAECCGEELDLSDV